MSAVAAKSLLTRALFVRDATDAKNDESAATPKGAAAE